MTSGASFIHDGKNRWTPGSPGRSPSKGTRNVYETPSAVARSQRLDILPALQLAFPEEPALYPNTIRDDSGYAAAEAFVEKRLGVKFTSPRPPFLTQNGRPF